MYVGYSRRTLVVISNVLPSIVLIDNNQKRKVDTTNPNQPQPDLNQPTVTMMIHSSTVITVIHPLTTATSSLLSITELTVRAERMW